MRKECRRLELGDVALLKRLFFDLEKARQDTPGEYSNIIEVASDEDDARQIALSSRDFIPLRSH